MKVWQSTGLLAEFQIFKTFIQRQREPLETFFSIFGNLPCILTDANKNSKVMRFTFYIGRGCFPFHHLEFESFATSETPLAKKNPDTSLSDVGHEYFCYQRTVLPTCTAEVTIWSFEKGGSNNGPHIDHVLHCCCTKSIFWRFLKDFILRGASEGVVNAGQQATDEEQAVWHQIDIDIWSDSCPAVVALLDGDSCFHCCAGGNLIKTS